MNTAAAALTLMAVLTACGGSGDDPAPAEARSTPAPSAASTAPTSPLVTDDLAGCDPADPAFVAAVQTSLDDGTQQVQDAFGKQDGELHYLVANIADAAGERVSSSDTWVATSAQGAGLAAASGSARNDLTTALPDGRDLYGAEPGGAAATALSACVQTTVRNRNSGG